MPLWTAACRPGSYSFFSLACVRGNTPVLHLISYFHVITDDFNIAYYRNKRCIAFSLYVIHAVAMKIAVLC